MYLRYNKSNKFYSAYLVKTSKNLSKNSEFHDSFQKFKRKKGNDDENHSSGSW